MASSSTLPFPARSTKLVTGIKQNARLELLGPSTNITTGSGREKLSLHDPSSRQICRDFGENPTSKPEHVQLQLNSITDQSLQSTRRMVGMMEESQEAGAKTMENLHRQGEQLHKAEDNLDMMNQEMRQAERNMEEMDKCCGLCFCPWRKRRKFRCMVGHPKSSGDKVDHRKEGGNDATAVRTKQPYVETVQQEAQRTNRQFVTGVTNDARENEMVENLGQVNSMLVELKSTATHMGQEIQKQNKQLDRMTTKTDVTEKQVAAADKQAKALLKKA